MILKKTKHFKILGGLAVTLSVLVFMPGTHGAGVSAEKLSCILSPASPYADTSAKDNQTPVQAYSKKDSSSAASAHRLSFDDTCSLGYNFSAVDSLMKKALKDSAFPGAVVLAATHGRVVYFKPFGRYSYDADAIQMRKDAMFDLASVTKVITTTTAAMMLYDDGRLLLDRKVKDYLPEFGNNGKEAITVRDLLLHEGGLPAFKPFYKTLRTPGEVTDAIMTSEVEFPVGTKFQYSDLGMITLQKIIEKIASKPLDQFLQERLFSPLKMTRTMYKPSPEYWYFCVPTEKDNYWRMTTLKGKVHDEAAYLLGGVAGHAGLFSTAQDIAVFLQMLLQKGSYDGMEFIKPETVKMWTKKQSTISTRALGWDTRSPERSSAGSLFSPNSFGHTGFTGTSVWVDPEREAFVILFTNRVNPTRNNSKLTPLRPRLHDAVIKALEQTPKAER